MITLLTGENNYAIRQALKKIIADFVEPQAIERFDGNELEVGDLPNLLGGLSLFATQRLIIISSAADNKNLWIALADHLEIIADEVHLVLIEETPDKRTKAYKLLQKIAQVQDLKTLAEPDAARWLVGEAAAKNIKLDSAVARKIVERAGTDQWQLYFALEKLAGTEKIDDKLIQEVIEPTPQASAFALIDTALARQPDKIQAMLKILRVSEDAYFFFGLLASQLFQLVALAAGGKPAGAVAKDLGTHPYPLEKMYPRAKNLPKSNLKSIAAIIADCDDRIKRSGAEPWEVVELALMKLANLKS